MYPCITWLNILLESGKFGPIISLKIEKAKLVVIKLGKVESISKIIESLEVANFC